MTFASRRATSATASSARSTAGSFTKAGVPRMRTARAVGGGKRFSVALIPHTLQITTLGQLQPGDPVNLETDVLAKYVEKQLAEGYLASRPVAEAE